MARPGVTGRKITSRQKRHRPGEDAMTIEEFCRRHSFSPALYYKLRLQGLMPEELRLGGRVLITKEAAMAWRAARTGKEAPSA